jgi:hypothetical protein
MSAKLVTTTRDVSGHHLIPKSLFCLRWKAFVHPCLFGQNLVNKTESWLYLNCSTMKYRFIFKKKINFESQACCFIMDTQVDHHGSTPTEVPWMQQFWPNLDRATTNFKKNKKNVKPFHYASIWHMVSMKHMRHVISETFLVVPSHKWAIRYMVHGF